MARTATARYGWASARRCLSQDVRAHTVVAAVFQRMSGVAPPRQRTNAGCPLFLGHARKLIYAEGAYYASSRVRIWIDFFCDNFIGNCQEKSSKFLRLILSRKIYMKFLRKFKRWFTRKFRHPFIPRKFRGNFFIKKVFTYSRESSKTELEGVIQSWFTPQRSFSLILCQNRVCWEDLNISRSCMPVYFVENPFWNVPFERKLSYKVSASAAVTGILSLGCRTVGCGLLSVMYGVDCSQ